MSSETAIATNLARVERAHEWITAKSERAQEIITLLHAGNIANDVKRNELHTLKVEYLDLFCISGLLAIPYDKKRSFLRRTTPVASHEVMLRKNIETLKIVSNGRYDASPLESVLSVYHNNPVEGECGSYNPSSNTIHINEYMLDDGAETADTVAHELWHAYQYERASNPSSPKDYEYLNNFENIIDPELDYEGYQDQLIESEARAFAEQFKGRLGK